MASRSVPYSEVSYRITESSSPYIQQEARGDISTDLFQNCPELEGTANYNNWLRYIEVCTPAAGFHPKLLKGEWPRPRILIVEKDNIQKWNRFMHHRAYWLSQNRSLVSYIKGTVAPSFRHALSECELVEDAMSILDNACPPAPRHILLSRSQRFLECSYDEATDSLPEFLAEFSKRSIALQNIRGGKLSVEDQCSRFLAALGPGFKDWAVQMRKKFKIDGNQTGQAPCFALFEKLAWEESLPEWEIRSIIMERILFARRMVNAQTSFSCCEANVHDSTPKANVQVSTPNPRVNDETEFWKQVKKDPERLKRKELEKKRRREKRQRQKAARDRARSKARK